MQNYKNSDHWLLIANSVPLTTTKLLTLARNKHVLVLDGAYTHARHTALTIDVLSGDFDSIDADDLIHAREAKVTIVHTPNQNKTDLEKGIDYLDSLNARSITICAATEGRLQHTLFNLRLLKRCYQNNRPLILYTETEMIRYVQDKEINIHGSIGDSIGILGFPHASITTNGLQYEVSDYLLDFAHSSSVCNALACIQAVIKVKGDALIIHEIKFLNESYKELKA
jgi:thiamine pyrophosphokinase